MTQVTPHLLLQAYASGIFPMAETRESAEVFWVDPKARGIIPIGGFHMSRSLRRRIRQAPFGITVNSDFAGVVRGCAEREETWINPTIFDLYGQLHRAGFAHSLEVRESGALVGGVYGVALGAAFFGESMFSRRRDASKIALAYLMDRLRAAGFRLFDTQFLTDHLASLGGIEISRADYRLRLREALAQSADFVAAGASPDPQVLLQRSSQTS